MKSTLKGLRPRIRLTNYCNGDCPYCFAKGYIDSEDDYMSEENVKLVIRTLKNVDVDHVAWQGGEPLIHPYIKNIIKLHIQENMRVSIFTNGLFDKDISTLLQFLDFTMLINVNHPNVYKNANEFCVIENNIKTLVDLGLGDRLSLGINYYKQSKDFEYIFELIRKYNIRSVRIDLARPSLGKENVYWQSNKISLAFNEIKEILQKCVKEGAIYSYFDCPFPICKLTDEDYTYYWRHIYLERIGRCYTDVDICSNLKIETCFCSIKYNEVYLNQFDNFYECYNWIKQKEEKFRWNYVNYDECIECLLRNSKICQGGCLGYRKKTYYPTLNLSNLENEYLPFYKLFLSRNEYDIEKFKEKYCDIEHGSFTDTRLVEINNYYKKLCASRIYINKLDYSQAKIELLSAYETVNFMDIQYIVKKLMYIEICMQVNQKVY